MIGAARVVLAVVPFAAWAALAATAAGWRTVGGLALGWWLSWLAASPGAERMERFAYGLIVGGALGNAIDRLAHGAVYDFLLFHAGRWAWPAFNLADSAITVGVALLLWHYRRPHDTPRPASQE